MAKQNSNYLGKIETEIQSNQSKVSMVLGVLIILVMGILVFNYFNRGKSDLGPAQTTTVEEQDVTPADLPGKYTVKEGDTLFIIAEKYYGDGYQYTEIARLNNLTNPDALEKGQVLEIPKLAAATLPVLEPEQTPAEPAAGSKGVPDITLAQSVWGPKIAGTTYTVVAGDWLSKIADRAYGDLYAYDKIAKANNIQNPDLIEVGMVLTIPR
ncbi:LysM peptidoglycan-binding domain-containing protein [Candidatus Daviesbacteria bacterium]|nr:LysM peptidoglycan-binding domain-containing protein [Candidatus Daviesbacteria bacterium]